MIGSVLGSYRLIQEIGGGGMGVVYSGEHQTLGRRAAIKVLHPQLSRDTGMVQRIFTEARAASLIAHPGLVDVYDFGNLPGGSAFIVMELLEGESLADRLDRQGKLPVASVVAIARQVASAVGAAHGKGIVHRDLKPDNVFLVRDDEVQAHERAKVLDFGIAKLAADEMQNSIRTKTGQLMGTPAYMSPEQCRGSADLDSRADVYSLGCIMFEMLTGRPPFDDESMGEIIAAHLYKKPPRLHEVNPSVPLWLDSVVARALAKRPEDRQQTMEQIASELAESRFTTLPPSRQATFPSISIDTPIKPPRRTGLLIALGGALAIAAAALGVTRLSRENQVVAAQPPPAPLTPTVVPMPAPAPLAVPTPPAAPVTVMLTIASQPAGAEVFRALDGIKLGTTPLELPMPRSSGVAVFVLKLSGHRAERVELAADRDGSADVVLSRARKSRHKKGGDDAVLDPFAR